jgi:hypothetical protein
MKTPTVIVVSSSILAIAIPVTIVLSIFVSNDHLSEPQTEIESLKEEQPQIAVTEEQKQESQEEHQTTPLNTGNLEGEIEPEPLKEGIVTGLGEEPQKEWINLDTEVPPVIIETADPYDNYAVTPPLGHPEQEPQEKEEIPWKIPHDVAGQVYTGEPEIPEFVRTIKHYASLLQKDVDSIPHGFYDDIVEAKKLLDEVLLRMRAKRDKLKEEQDKKLEQSSSDKISEDKLMNEIFNQETVDFLLRSEQNELKSLQSRDIIEELQEVKEEEPQEEEKKDQEEAHLYHTFETIFPNSIGVMIKKVENEEKKYKKIHESVTVDLPMDDMYGHFREIHEFLAEIRAYLQSLKDYYEKPAMRSFKEILEDLGEEQDKESEKEKPPEEKDVLEPNTEPTFFLGASVGGKVARRDQEEIQEITPDVLLSNINTGLEVLGKRLDTRPPKFNGNNSNPIELFLMETELEVYTSNWYINNIKDDLRKFQGKPYPGENITGELAKFCDWLRRKSAFMTPGEAEECSGLTKTMILNAGSLLLRLEARIGMLKKEQEEKEK